MNQRIEMSYQTILVVISLLIGIWLLVQIKDIIITLFVSFILVSSLGSMVTKLERLRFPRPLAIGIIYTVLLSIIVLFLTVVFPPLINESIKLARKTPQYSGTVLQALNINPDMLTQQVTSFSSNVINVIKNIFSDVFAILATLVITFYMLLERKNLDQFLTKFLGEEKAKEMIERIRKIEIRLGGWIRGQIFLCTVIGIMSYIGLRFLDIEYALPLALIAGILEIVPVVGPIISAIPAVIIALLSSPELAIAVIALYTIIQQIENHLIVPNVMRTAVGLKPIVTIIALMIGGKLLGITGALLAVPMTIVLQETIEELLLQKGILQKSA